MSFEAVPENSQRRSWGDVGWQTVAEAASSYWKCTIASSGQVRRITSCEDDDDRRRWQLELAMRWM